MLKFPFWKKLLILLPSLWGIYSFSPHFFYSQVEKYNDLKKTEINSVLEDKSSELLWYDWAPSNLVNLGLDLRGGAHVLVEVKLAEVYSERLQNFWPEIRTILRTIRDKIGPFSQELSPDNEGFLIFIEKDDYIDDAITVLKTKLSSKNSVLKIAKFKKKFIRISFDEQEKRKIDNQTMDQSLEIIRRRVDEAGTREPTIQKQGTERILIQVPGLGSAEELLQLIGKTAKLTFHPVLKNSVSCGKNQQVEQ